MLDAAGILGEAGGAGADGRRFPRSDGYSGRSLLPVLRGGRAAAEHAAVRNELHDLLLAHLGETGDLLAGPGWARRPWRGGAAERPFEGYFTTGYRDRWPSGSFFTSGDVAAVEWQLSTAERQEIDTIFAEKGVPTHAETAQITEPFLPAR